MIAHVHAKTKPRQCGHGLRTANQPPRLAGYNLYEQDAALVEGVRREGGGPWEAEVAAFRRSGGRRAARVGAAGKRAPAGAADARPLRRAHRRDRVPSRLGLAAAARLDARLHRCPGSTTGPGAHVARAALFMLLGQVEAGVGCPLSMTFASVPALRAAARARRRVDPRAAERRRALRDGDDRTPGRIGRARERDDRAAGRRCLGAHGHKWFCSAPIATRSSCSRRRRPGHLLPGGAAAARLSDRAAEGQARQPLERLGGGRARRRRRRAVGEEGRGVRTILEMVNHTRLDCVLGSTALMRRAVAEATHHAAHRIAFGRLLTEQPLMRNVLADLCVEGEAATVPALRLARAYDEADGRSAGSRPRSRSTGSASGPAARRRGARCLGGNGYVEENPFPRLFRRPAQLDLGRLGQRQRLDVLRALAREPEPVAAFLAELRLAAGADRAGTRRSAGWRSSWPTRRSSSARPEARAARGRLQGALLVRHGTPAVADAFCARLGVTAASSARSRPRVDPAASSSATAAPRSA